MSISTLTHAYPPLATLFPYTTLFRSGFTPKCVEVDVHGRTVSPTRTVQTRSLSPKPVRCSRSTPMSRRPRAPRHRCPAARAEEHTSELLSLNNIVCRLLLEKKRKKPH